MTTGFQISIDLSRFLGKIGPQLYADPAAVLEELVQNAQRSCAGSLDLVFVSDFNEKACVQLLDDGVGLGSPEDLLRIAASGWSEETQATEDPFGMGFWSVVSVAGTVEVRSNHWLIVIDAAGVRAGVPLEDVLTVTEVDDSLSGFQVRLWSPVGRSMDEEQLEANPLPDAERQACEAWGTFTNGIRTRFEQMVRYMDFSSARFGRKWAVSPNDWELELTSSAEMNSLPTQMDRKTGPGVPFEMTVDDDMMEGVLWLGKSMFSSPEGWSHQLQLMYQDRIVEERYTRAQGVLFMKPGVVGVRAPDRKAFLMDSRLTEMNARIREYKRAAYRQLLDQGTDEDIESRQDGALEVLKDEDLLAHLKVKLTSLDAVQALVTPEQHVESMEKQAEEPVLSSVDVAPREADDEVVLQAAREVVDPPKVVKKAALAEGIALQDLKGTIVWADKETVAREKEAVADLAGMGIKLVVATNRLIERGMRVAESIGIVRSLSTILAGKRQDVAKRKADLTLQHATLVVEAVTPLAAQMGLAKVTWGDLRYRDVIKVGDQEMEIAGSLEHKPLAVCKGTEITLDVAYLEALAEKALADADPVRSLQLRLVTTLAHEAAHLTNKGHGYEHAESMQLYIETALTWMARR